MMFAHLGKPFGRGEGEQVVAAVHRLFYLDRVGDDVVEALWRVGEALQLHLKAEAVAHVEVAAIVEPGESIAIFIELILIGRQFAEELIEAVVLWCRFILLVEHIVGKLCCQLYGAEEERHGSLHMTALLIMVPAEELDVGEVDFVRVVWRHIFVQGILDEIVLVLIERDVGAVAFLAFGSKGLPDAGA